MMLPGKVLENEVIRFGKTVLFDAQVLEKIKDTKGRQSIATRK
jgi:hypothetical protein